MNGNSTRLVGILFVGVVGLVFAFAVAWQLIHGHEADAVATSILGTIVGNLLPPITGGGQVAVTNQPVATTEVEPKARKR
jgi:hypothetical protein